MADPIVAPTTIPGPSAAPLTPTERRLLSDLGGGPRQSRVIQRDYHALQKLEWLFKDSEALIFFEWWRDTLYYGGAWFAAQWPMPQGWDYTTVRRFVDTPQWQAVPGGSWRVTATCEIRGRSQLPVDDAGGGLLVTSLGWNIDVHSFSPGESPAAGNSGSETFGFFSTTYYAYIVNYNEIVSASGFETVILEYEWFPAIPGDPSPTVTQPFGAIYPYIQVDVADNGNPYGTYEGELRIYAFVDGGSTISNGIVLAMGAPNYNTVSWGPYIP